MPDLAVSMTVVKASLLFLLPVPKYNLCGKKKLKNKNASGVGLVVVMMCPDLDVLRTPKGAGSSKAPNARKRMGLGSGIRDLGSVSQELL